MNPAYTDNGAAPNDALIGGDHKLVTEEVVVIAGENLTRGALLGKITVSGKVNLSLSAAGDGSEVPWGVLTEDVDATAGDVTAVAYITGQFNEDKVTLGTGHTLASVKDGLRGKSIYLVPADGA